ncbi:MAG: phage portal protein [Bacilli bacterium]
MFAKVKDIIGKLVSKIFRKETVQQKLNVDVAVSDDMVKGIELWSKMYENKSPWISNTIKSMNLASSIAGELARLTTIEFESEITGNDYLNEQYKTVLEKLREQVEYGCANGGLIFKPYVNGENIEVDFVQADGFYPTSYNSRKEITGAIFTEFKQVGKKLYTRLEYHNLTDEGYYISNTAYMKESYSINVKAGNDLGNQVSLKDIDSWSELEEEVLIKNIDKPLFSYFRIPLANHIDKSCPLGVSVYARAIDDIQEADKHYSRILWEYEGSELSVDVDIGAFKRNKDDELILPDGKERLYRTLDYGDETKWNVFSPEIRDTSLFNGLNKLLRNIEFKCGLAYGTISDVSENDKTATEIKSSKQRSYSTVKDIQKSLEKSLIDLAYVMDVWTKLANLPSSKYEISFNWDDSLVMTKEEELQSMANDVASGLLRAEIYLAKKYGVSEEEALKMMPQTTAVTKSPFDDMEE